MEHVNKVAAEFEKYAANFPEFVVACNKQGIPPGMVLLGLTATVTVIGIIM